MADEDLVKLQLQSKHYEWGCVGLDGIVAKLLRAGDHSEIADCEAYAELWIATHKNGDSYCVNEGVKLSEFIKSHPQYLAPHENGKMDYILKVLSINSVLSIQTHPTKSQAEILHSKDPKHYPDTNHKPEMAVAISDDFHALVGFRPAEEIYRNFVVYPELTRLIGGEENSDWLKALIGEDEQAGREALRNILRSIYSAKKADVHTVIEDVYRKITTSFAEDCVSVFHQAYSSYPDDVGFFMPFFLNWVHVPCYSAITINANVPHAYVSGDCVEVMACSDNTIRAGLTPKFKDIPTLLQNIDLTMAKPTLIGFKPTKHYMDTIIPEGITEFSIEMIRNSTYELKVVASSVFIVIKGHFSLVFDEEKSYHVNEGDAFFMPYTKKTVLVDADGIFEEFIAFRAYKPDPDNPILLQEPILVEIETEEMNKTENEEFEVVRKKFCFKCIKQEPEEE